MRLRTERARGTVTVYRNIKINYKRLTPGEIKNIRLRNTSTAKKEPFDATAFAFDMFDEQVESWENAIGKNDEVLVCDRKTKKMLFKHDQDFIGEAQEAIRMDIEKRADLEDKEEGEDTKK